MKKRNLKLDLKKDVISKLEMGNILGGNLPTSNYNTSPSLVASCTWTVGDCHPAPVPTCDACPTAVGNNTCPCTDTVYCTTGANGSAC